MVAEQFGPLWMTLAIEITLPTAEEPVIDEPGKLNPTSPPRAELTPVLLTVPEAKEAVIEAGLGLESPLAPTSPPTELAAPPGTVPLAAGPGIVPQFAAARPP